jgi:hypothetical protein
VCSEDLLTSDIGIDVSWVPISQAWHSVVIHLAGSTELQRQLHRDAGGSIGNHNADHQNGAADSTKKEPDVLQRKGGAE